MTKKKLSIGAWIGIGVGAVVLIIIMYCVTTYNSLVRSEQEVDAKWSQVQNVMQRRYDLVPNLVNSVKGAMKHETKVFGDISAARKEYNKASTPNDKLAADAQVNNSVGTLISAIGENYPELKSNEEVQTLMTQLEGSENRISTERGRYIEEVANYNKKVVTFPRNIVANMFGKGKMPVYKADTKASEAPTVDLGE